MSSIKSYAALKKQIKTAEHAFALLGVAADTEQEELYVVRRALALEFHPDRNSDPDAAGIMASVNSAVTTLSSKQLRKSYMAALRAGRVACDECKGVGSTKKQMGFAKVKKTPCAKCGGCGLMKREPA